LLGEFAMGDVVRQTLFLLFCCCHPDLAPASQVALTLRAVDGLTTREIADAFYVPEATIARPTGLRPVGHPRDRRGVRVLQSALTMQTEERRPGRYQVEAAIANARSRSNPGPREYWLFDRSTHIMPGLSEIVCRKAMGFLHSC
jgi:predicted RNA polymerase sigma factor